MKNLYLSIFCPAKTDLQKLCIFQGTISGNTFILPIEKKDIKISVLAVEYVLSGVNYHLTICN
jgi:hypothetical protein